MISTIFIRFNRHNSSCKREVSFGARGPATSTRSRSHLVTITIRESFVQIIFYKNLVADFIPIFCRISCHQITTFRTRSVAPCTLTVKLLCWVSEKPTPDSWSSTD